MQRLELRPYQKEAVEKGIEFFRSPTRENGILVISTGGGKTLVVSEIANRLDENILVFQPSKEILEQNLESMRKYTEDCSAYSASVGEKKVSKITFATIGSVKEHINEFKHFRYVLADECFTGETEILTEKGWQRFDRLDHSLKVAQYNNGIVSFVYPSRYIEREHEGDMCRFRIRQNIQVPMTCGHELLLYNPQKDIYKKVTVDNFSPNNFHWRIPLAGVCEMADEQLTPLERLYIAFQADGSFQMVTRNYTKGIFSFTKERKINRFKMLCHLANIKYSEVKDKNNNRHRFIATFPAGTTKFIRKHIKFPMSYQKARAILEECALWDGYIQNDHTLYYGSTVEDNTNFYSEVAALAGYSAIKTIQHDNRETFYKDVHRLFIHKNKTSKDTQTASVEHYYYKGKVYCVEVPSHNIVIRHNGYSFVTGNCHTVSADNENGMYIKFLSMLDCKVLGLTATPYRLYADTVFDFSTRKMTSVNARLLMLPQVANPFFTKILYIVQNKDMFDQGYLCRPKYYECKPPRWNEDKMFTNSMGSDYSEKSIQWMMETSDMTKHLISICRRLLQPKTGVPRNGILVFTQFVEDAEEICANVAYSAFVCGTTTKKNRERIIQEFREGKIKVLVNVSALSTGFNVPSLDTVVLGRPTLSLSLYLQQVGRAVRRFDGKDAWIVDCVGNTSRFGYMENIYIAKPKGKDKEEVFGYVIDKKTRQYHWKQLTGVPLKQSEENLFVK